jgi:hypothetical protein
MALSAAFALFSWIALPFLFSWIGNPIYQNAQHWYPWLLMAMVLNALSMVPHYALYASGKDKHIIYSHIAALPMFAVAVWAFSDTYAALAIPFGLNAAFGFILVWKSIAYTRQNIERNTQQAKSTPLALTANS